MKNDLNTPTIKYKRHRVSRSASLQVDPVTKLRIKKVLDLASESRVTFKPVKTNINNKFKVKSSLHGDLYQKFEVFGKSTTEDVTNECTISMIDAMYNSPKTIFEQDIDLTPQFKTDASHPIQFKWKANNRPQAKVIQDEVIDGELSVEFLPLNEFPQDLNIKTQEERGLENSFIFLM